MSHFSYTLISDLHANNWSAFSSLDKEGRNTRLMIIIHEIDRACQATLDAGGSIVIMAGDLFHIRGKIEPSVFNPVQDCIDKWIKKDISFWAIPGNHDLESEDSTKLGNALEMLHRKGFNVVCNTVEYELMTPHAPSKVLFVPYSKSTKTFFGILDMMKEAIEQEGRQVANVDVICHLGIDGTLAHLPEHGASAERLAAYGFKRVFSGDYHHHKDFGNGIYSIGATSHQTWSDAGTKAGFLMVYDDKVVFQASHAPSFLSLQGDEDHADLPMIVDGHYIQAKIGTASAIQVQAWRDALISMGAKGVIIKSVPDTTKDKRAGVASKSMTSLPDSIQEYCKEKAYPEEVMLGCADVLEAVL